MTDILDLDGAAALLHVSAQTIRKQAAAGKLPGAKVGRTWVFVRSDLIAHVSGQARQQQEASTPPAPPARAQRAKPAPRSRRRALPCLDTYLALRPA